MTSLSQDVPYIQPEGALLYKAKACRPKDQADFDACAPFLSTEARKWLRDAIERLYPGHYWLEALG